MATVRDFVCFKANCTETALFIKLCKPPTCDVNNAMYYHTLIRLTVPRALVANKVYSMNALIKTIHFEIFSSLLLPKGKVFRLSHEEILDQFYPTNRWMIKM